MKNVISRMVINVILLSACTNGPEKREDTATREFYPVFPFIHEELDKVDSLPVAVFKYTETATHSDTFILDKVNFRKSVDTLFSPDISSKSLRGKYSEKVFLDKTINRVTISYNTEDPEPEIRRLDIFIDPDKEKVKNIYVEKNTRSGDSLIIRKMMWSAGRRLQVTSYGIRDGRQGPVIKESYVWDQGN